MPAPSTPEEVAGTATQEVQTLSQLRLPQRRSQERLLKGSGGLEFMPAPSTPEEAAGTATQGTGRSNLSPMKHCHFLLRTEQFCLQSANFKIFTFLSHDLDECIILNSFHLILDVEMHRKR